MLGISKVPFYSPQIIRILNRSTEAFAIAFSRTENTKYARIFQGRIIYLSQHQKIDMKLSLQAENILAQVNTKTKLGDLRKIAKDIKKDHELMELWSQNQL